MTKTDHLIKAREDIAIAESGDAKNAAYMSAAVHIRDSGASNREAAKFVGRSEGWIRPLLKWADEFAWGAKDPTHPPFGGSDENEARYERADRRKVEDAIRERPEAVAEAIAKAPAEVQRKLADELVRQPTESSLRSLAEPRERTPREQKSTERKLSDATFLLWEVGELLQDAPTPAGEEKVRMLASAEKAQRLAAGIVHLLDTGEFEDEFRALLDEARV